MRYGLRNTLCVAWVIAGPLALGAFALGYGATRATLHLLNPFA